MGTSPLDRLSVTRGETIELNTPLFTLESKSERDAERQAQGQLAAAKAQLADLEKGKRPQELDVTRAQLQQALAEQQKSALQLTRDEAQYKDAGISQAALETSQALAKSDAAQVRMLRSELAVAMLPARRDQIRAETAQVAAAKAALAQAAWKVNQKAVTATRAGLVFDTIYRVGEWVQAGSPVVQMLPPENLKVRFFVPEPLLGRLSLGQPVLIYCDGCSGNIPAKITYISDQAEYTPPVIYSNEQRSKLIYMIEAHPSPEQASRLHPGQPVEVRLP
jgi:HlyD family secretion protein